MFSVSQDFAPPFKLISPFFILGAIFYLLCSMFLFFFSTENIALLDTKILSFVHLFLLGFIMMTIFGAMAQLVPVVLEVGHFGVELFYAIWPLLGIGTFLMVWGFFLTIKKVKKYNLVMISILISNIFLFFGIIFGLIIALGYAGTIEVDISNLLKSHVFLVVGGYIIITLMGLSVVLLPMFGLSHGFSLKPLEIAMTMMSIAVVIIVLSSFINSTILEYIGYALTTVSLFIYFYLVQTIYKTRARKEIDIYVMSLFFAYISMIVSLVFGVIYLVSGFEPLLMSAGWLMFFGFFGFAVTGHVYKIVPFLVWFERFSPLVGKQKVPMLVDMVPAKSSHAQVVFCGAGVIIIAVAILLQNDTLIKAGASFLVVGSIAFLRNVLYMINYKVDAK